MKTYCTLIAVAAVAMCSVPVQANQCCEFDGSGPGDLVGCISSATINQNACTLTWGGTFTDLEFCNTTTATCDPKPGGDDLAICQDVPQQVCCQVTEGASAEFCDPIPTVSEWGLVVMVVMLLTAGTVILGRRRQVAAA